LKWIPEWSYADRELIERNLTRLGAQTFYMPPSRGYVGCVDVHGRIVMYLHYGYAEFRRELAPADLPNPDWPGLTFSTFRPGISPNRRMLTRQQALDWIPEWSYADRELIERNLTRLGAQTFYMPPGGDYVGCVDVHGRVVMILYYGYVTFKRDLAPADLPNPDWPELPLSTFRGPRSPTPSPDDEDLQFCPIHNIALPLTGKCDYCQ
jgi:hypothetical protein